MRLKNGQYQYILTYVDDLLICCQHKEDVNEIANELKTEIEIKQLGEIKYYLGMEIEKLNDGSFLLSQKQKIVDFIESVGMKNCKPVSTPLESTYLKLKDGQLFTNHGKYQEAIGKLLYLSKTTRPDIAAAVNILSRKVSSPNHHDWNAIKRVARYLKGTEDLTLKISSCENPRLVAYMDASWGEESMEYKSTSGYLFYFGNNLVDWTSRKQTVMAQSSAEAECISAANACNDLEWILHLLKDFGINEPTPVVMFEDNQACITICKGESIKARSRAIGLRCQSVKNLYQKGLIDIYCPTDEMVADILTKPLTRKVCTFL
ncbi:uncharacterized protein PHA67_007869 [Liasis olivaceus]